MQVLISLCAQIAYMYYCEYAHLLKKRTEHTCMSAIYYDQSSEIKADRCKTIVTFDTLPESKILDAGDILILSNLQNHPEEDQIFEDLEDIEGMQTTIQAISFIACGIVE